MSDLIPPFGAEGFNVEGDVITVTADGRDLNGLWRDYQASLQLFNEARQKLVNLLTFDVSTVIEDVPVVGVEDFEEASEFGVPRAARPVMTYFSMAYDFRWYDRATRFTWKFLAEASADQVDAVHAVVLEADNKNVFKKVMNAIFRNTTKTATITGNNYNVYPLYSNDGTVPPPYKSNTFDGTHNHYLASGAAAVDSGDVEAMIDHLEHHGYGVAQGTKLVLLVNKTQGDAIRSWRANVTNANSAVAKYDFIPAQGEPATLMANNLVIVGGGQPAALYEGLRVIGSYGNVTIVQEDYIPAGYMVMIGTGGEGSLANPVGFRQHANANLRGLRLIPGDRNAYPLVNSYYSRGFGTGIRQRGGAVVMKVTAGSYTIPTEYA